MIVTPTFLYFNLYLYSRPTQHTSLEVKQCVLITKIVKISKIALYFLFLALNFLKTALLSANQNCEISSQSSSRNNSVFSRGTSSLHPRTRRDDHVGTDHIGTDHVGTDHVGTDHVGTDHVSTDHVGTDHVGTDHVGTDLIGTDRSSWTHDRKCTTKHF